MVTAGDPSTVWRRDPAVLSRIGTDRVLVRRVDGAALDPALDLVGPPALVWVALDQPGTVADLADRLGDAALFTGTDEIEQVLASMADHRLVTHHDQHRLGAVGR